jgi:tetratricopeptide (TPR) repeat protein
MPLAIVLAASWAELLSPAQIADRIAQGLAFLRTDLRDVPLRHQSMQAVFDASWAGLSEGEREAFPALAVFRGSFALEGAQVVSGASLEAMRGLVRKSFVIRRPDERFEIHELLRQYGEGKLRERPGGVEEALDAHCRYYARYFADRAVEIRRQGLGDAAPDVENLLAAWRWAAQRRDAAALRAFLGREMGGIDQIYLSLSLYAQGAPDFERAVATLRQCEPTRENQVALALALRKLGLVATRYTQRYHHQGGRRAMEESIAILEQLGVEAELALSQIMETITFCRDLGNRQARLEASLALCRKAGCKWGIAWACGLLALGATHRGAYNEAEAYIREELEISQALGHVQGMGYVARNQAYLARIRGQYDRARACYEESLAASRSMGARGTFVSDLNALGDIALQMGDYAEARRCHREALAVAQELGDRVPMAIAIAGLGDLARARGDEEGAEKYYTHALAISPVPNKKLRPHMLLRQAGQVAAQGDAALAVELATMALHRPLADDETRTRARRLLAELESRLSPGAYAAAVEIGVSQAPSLP